MAFRLRRPDTGLLVASLIIAGCLVGIAYAVDLAITGDEGDKLPATIQEIAPVRNATQVPAQTQVYVDLLAGNTGVIIIDGLELETVNLDEVRAEAKPGQQIELPLTTIYEPGNATLTFRPTAGSSIERFSEGEHVVEVIYWSVVEGRGSARSFSWTFSVF
jgi:hypothetical protein